MSSIHLTLKFLGDIDPEQVAPILESLEPKISSFEPVSLRIRGLGVFPSLSRPRVAWAGVVDAEGRLARLQSGVEEALQECGFEPEPRKFSPHITLARIKSVGNRVLFTALLGQMRDFDMGSSTVRTVNLYQSILRPEGAEYRVLGGISSSEWK